MAVNPRAKYLTETISTASPARLVVMLYDRLLLDIASGRDALGTGKFVEADRRLRHAQDIVLELRGSLDVNKWDAAPKLASIYGWLLKELVLANVNKDAEEADECHKLVEPLRDAWHNAAAKLAAEGQLKAS